MKNIFKILTSIILLFSLIQCKEKNDTKDTVLTGAATVAVDESILPVIQDQVEIFEDAYKAKIFLQAKAESEVLNALLKDSVQIAILARNLSDDEMTVFKNRKVTPKVTKFATDAIALIAHKSNNDSIIKLEDVINFMKGQKVSGIEGIVFDNLNSSTARQLLKMGQILDHTPKNVYSFNTNDEVVKYVADNKGMIGVIGINWIMQPSANMQEYINDIQILSVKDLDSELYIAPTQNNLAEGTYPLARDLFIINSQGRAGLGMGFASFIAGERGQRIILKAGLLPTRMPGRNLILRKTINVEKK